MWNGKLKAVTFSYDDGVEQDRRLVEIFGRYGMKATFNLNSGLMNKNSTFMQKDILVRRINKTDIKDLYDGHEIAVHCLTHANLLEFDEDTIYNEIKSDKDALEDLFDIKIEGMAYPFGTYNETVKKIARECGIRYARTVKETGGFSISDDLLELKASASHNREDIFDMIDRFVRMRPSEPSMLYIWGHSYEFDRDRTWDRIEEICRRLAFRDDIFYGTNREVLLTD